MIKGSDNRALVLFSGGQDSTTCLYWAKEKFEEVAAVNLMYGQRHIAECSAAEIICNLAGINFWKINLGDFFVSVGNSALVTSQDISEAHKSDVELPASFLPGRNIVLITVAACIGYRERIPNIITGVCQTDYSGYPDCRFDTIKSLESTLRLGMDYEFTIYTPLMYLSKAESVEMARKLPGCWEALAQSHTCYEGRIPPCSECPACQLRAKGFERAGYKDPLIERLKKEGLV